MAILALPTAWLLSLDEEGPGPWLMAFLWIALTAWNLALGMFSLPVTMVIWLLWRRRRIQREVVQFVNRHGWKEVSAPAGFHTAYDALIGGRPALVLLGFTRTQGAQGRTYLNPIVGFQLQEGDWPSGWEDARKRRGGLFPARDLPYRVEGKLLVFEGVHRVPVLQARLRDLEGSLAPNFDWSRVGRRKKMHPVVFWGLILGIFLVALSQWIAWQKLRVFPADPSLLMRSASSLPRLQAVIVCSSDPGVAAAGDRLAVSGRYQSIQLYELSGRAVSELPDSQSWSPVAFSGTDVAAVNQEGAVRLWPATEVGTVTGPESLACAGDFIACGDKAGEVVVFARTGGVVARMTRSLAAVTALACAEDQAVCGCEDGSVYLFELATGKLLAEHAGDGSPVLGVGFCEGGVVTMQRNGCRTWTPELQPLKTLSAAESVAGASDARQICAGYLDGSIEVYRGGTTLRLVGHQAPITTLALSPDGKRLYSGANDYTVKVWKLD